MKFASTNPQRGSLLPLGFTVFCQFRSFLQANVCRNRLEITLDFVLLLADGVKEESLSRNVYIEFGNLPIVGFNLGLFHAESSALVYVAQDSEAKLHA